MYFVPYNKNLKDFSKYLRTHSTLGEVLLWNQLKQGQMLGYTFYRQKPIDNYIVDGFDPITNTVYEFYGDYWHGNPNKKYNSDINMKSKTLFSELYQNTINRERYLISKGFNIISIWEDDFIKQK